MAITKDTAIIRPGRIDHKIQFGNASVDVLERIYKFYLDQDLPKNIAKKLGKRTLKKTTGYIITA